MNSTSSQSTTLLGPRTHIRFQQIVGSRWWYVVGIVYFAVRVAAPHLSDRTSLVSRVCESVVLLVCCGRFIVPSLVMPGTLLARGWFVLAVQWLVLAGYRMAGYEMSDISGWQLYLLTIIVYVPIAVLLIGGFVVLPFAHRRRTSVALDVLAVSIGLTIVVSVMLQYVTPQATLLDAVFVGADLALLYALILLLQQQPQRWKPLFVSLVVGVLAIALTDLAWVLYRAVPTAATFVGPMYTIAWLLLARTALVLPNASTSDPSRLLIEAPLMQFAPYLALGGGLLILINLPTDPRLVSVLLGMLLLRVGVELAESRSLSRRLDYSRQAEHTARTDAEELRELIRSSIHDLRSPIDAATGLLTLLETPVEHSATTTSRVLSLLHEQIVNLGNQMTDLLDAARAVLLAPPTQPLNLTRIIAEQVASADQFQALRRTGTPQLAAVAIQHTCDPDLWARGSERALRRVLENLIRNSLQHGATAIELTASVVDGTVLIVVQDNGPGYPPQILQYGIQPGFSGRPDGYGFGLIGVAANVRAMNGSISIANADGARTTVRLAQSEAEHTR